MAYVALDTVLLGRHGEIHAGAEIPATYLDLEDNEQQTDFDRLVVLGVAEKKAAKSASKK